MTSMGMLSLKSHKDCLSHWHKKLFYANAIGILTFFRRWVIIEYEH